MKVILLNDLHAVGKQGDVVRTKPGYARNYLIPQGHAVLATNSNMKWFDQRRKKIEAKNLAERQVAVEAAVELDGVSVTIKKRAGETDTLYGSVTAAEVAEALEMKGLSVDRRQIDLQGGIKSLGEHQASVHLHSDVTALLEVVVEPEE